MSMSRDRFWLLGQAYYLTFPLGWRGSPPLSVYHPLFLSIFLFISSKSMSEIYLSQNSDCMTIKISNCSSAVCASLLQKIRSMNKFDSECFKLTRRWILQDDCFYLLENLLRKEHHRRPEMSTQLGHMIENYNCGEISHIFK